MRSLLQGLDNRTQRVFCVEYLTIIVQTWGSAVLERHLDQLANTIPTLLEDGQSQVRVAARTFYWTFVRRFHDRNGKILSSIEPNTKKYLYVFETLIIEFDKQQYKS